MIVRISKVSSSVLRLVLQLVATLAVARAVGKWHEGTYESKDLMPIVEQREDGRVYAFEGGDELVGARVGYPAEAQRISSLSFSQLLHMPSGEFLIPVVQQPLENITGASGLKVVKLLKVEIVRPEAFLWRQSDQSRRHSSESGENTHPSTDVESEVAGSSQSSTTEEATHSKPTPPTPDKPNPPTEITFNKSFSLKYDKLMIRDTTSYVGGGGASLGWLEFLSDRAVSQNNENFCACTVSGSFGQKSVCIVDALIGSIDATDKRSDPEKDCNDICSALAYPPSSEPLPVYYRDGTLISKISGGLSLAPGLCCNTMGKDGVGASLLTKAGALFCAPELSDDEKASLLEYRKQAALEAARKKADDAARQAKKAKEEAQKSSEKEIKKEEEAKATVLEVREKQKKKAEEQGKAQELENSRLVAKNEEAEKKARKEKVLKEEQEAKALEQKKAEDAKIEELKNSLCQQLEDLDGKCENTESTTVEDIRRSISSALAAKEAESSDETPTTLPVKTPKISYIYTSLTFRNKGPLGIDLIPNKLPFTIATAFHNLAPGDELVSINEEDVIEAEEMDEVFVVLSEAVWPKTLKFRRAVKEAEKKSARQLIEEKASGGVLRFKRPAILKDFLISYRVAEFGKLRPRLASLGLNNSNKSDDSGFSVCERESLRVSVDVSIPDDGCTTVKQYIPAGYGETDASKNIFKLQMNPNIYALIKRGGCQFTKKAEEAELAGFGGMIVFNEHSDEEVIRMPGQRHSTTKELLPVKFDGQGLMVGSEDGLLIETALSLIKLSDGASELVEMYVESWDCEASLKETQTDEKPWEESMMDNAIKADPSVAAAHASTMAILKASTKFNVQGELYLWSGFDSSRPIPFLVADFGMTQLEGFLGIQPARTVKGNPADGCDEKGFSVNARGAWVILERGQCSFVDKVMNVQRVGGLMAIIRNTRKKPYLFRMPKGPHGAPGINIPAIMIGHDATSEIEKLGGSNLGRLHIKHEAFGTK